MGPPGSLTLTVNPTSVCTQRTKFSITLTTKTSSATATPKRIPKPPPSDRHFPAAHHPRLLPSMAPSFENLREEDLDENDFDEDEVDISDLREKYEVSLEQGYDTFVVIDGLPAVTEEQKPKLVKFLLKKLNTIGKTREDLIFMPMGEDGKSLR